VVAVVLELDNDSDLMELALEIGRERLLGSDPGFVKRALFSIGVSLAMPRSVTVWISPGESPTKPRYLAVASMDRGGRIIRLLGRGIIKSRLIDAPRQTVRVEGARITSAAEPDDGMSPAAFAFESDSLLIASDLGMIRDVLAPDTLGAAAEQFAADIVGRAEDSADISVIGTNRTAQLTGMVQALEQRLAEAGLAFALMPSADALSTFTIGSSIVSGDLNGSAEFSYADPERLAEGESDVLYIYRVLRRKLDGMGMDMGAEISVRESIVRMDFSVLGLADYLRSTNETESDTGE